ncbi:PilZ domain-containing protein [Bowmanella dokdonensis]|uniref:PilZ domain-containing protein n=1 Tax=Bowmanella dokdonensis TaxID=751969 RepID=A0A939IR04_9ALTE|nr:PilZ domain-containing protein [Bowmanella dokdonensis]MBN7827475.1 PilZ domain-containing protein [Bowmanella dokdonensis]
MKANNPLPVELQEKLIPQLSSPNLDKVLLDALPGSSASERFLCKMELRRLAKPCLRTIDLRGSVEGQCYPFQFQERTHYLDSLALEEFKRQLTLYGGFTQGVYEAVHQMPNNYRVMQEQARAAQAGPPQEKDAARLVSDRYLAQTILFRNYALRREERMNFVIQLEVRDEKAEHFSATSIDLSVSGLQIKTGLTRRFTPGQKLTVYFRGLEQDYVLDKSGLGYEVVRTEYKKDNCYLCLNRTSDNLDSSMDQFLQTFIHGNKRRYKVNLENTFEAVLAKGYEQYFTTVTSSLPVFIDDYEKVLQPRFLLLNDRNQSLYLHWQKAAGNQLGYLFRPGRLNKWRARPGAHSADLLYSFCIQRDGRDYWYSAALSELKNNPLLHQTFLSYGARQSSWRVYTVQCQRVSADQSHAPSTLPDSLGQTIRKLNRPTSARLMSLMKHLRWLILLTDVTDEKARTLYQALPLSNQHLPLLKAQAHPRNQPPEPIQAVSFQYRSLRQEDRYKLSSRARLSVAGTSIDAVTEDISCHGIKLRLDSQITPPDVLTVSFGEFQELTTKYRLKDIPYQVRHWNAEKKVLSLQLYRPEQGVSEQAARFFTELLDKNKRKLAKDPEHQDSLELGEALKRIMVTSAANPCLFMVRQGATYVADTIALPGPEHRFPAYCLHESPAGSANLSMLLTREAGRYFIEQLKGLSATAEARHLELYIVKDARQPGKAVNVLFRDQLENEGLANRLISLAQQKGTLEAYRLLLTRTGRPDTSGFEAELKYINLYASHKARALEDRLWEAGIVCEILDISDEVLQRFDFKAQENADLSDNINNPA